MAKNGVILQCFQWYTPVGGVLWKEVEKKAESWAQAGITAVWFPPSYKGASGGFDVGYGAYDLFDLGEFNQKNTVATKYGTRDELLAAVKAVQKEGLQAYADVVFNHKGGGDKREDVRVQQVDWNDRNRPISDWHTIQAYTLFDFSGRGKKYSSFKWHWWCFDALAHNASTNSSDKLYRLKDRSYATEVCDEFGNYDFLMFNDLDMKEELVREELMYWGRWFIDTTGFDGFRIDAVKHIRSSWFTDWLNHLRVHFGEKELFSVGEYWSQDIEKLHGYLEQCDGVMSLFDVPLHYQFHRASKSGSSFDMRTLWDNTLMKEQPAKAVTFVENHDTQPGQMLESPVESWFKPLAYAFILLRQQGYPCVFLADIEGDAEHYLDSHQFLIEKFLDARRNYSHGDQHDYFDHPNTIGWVRTGNADHPGAMAVVMTNGSEGTKWMNVFKPGAKFSDVTGHFDEGIVANEEGWAEFRCPAGKVSVWVEI